MKLRITVVDNEEAGSELVPPEAPAVIHAQSIEDTVAVLHYSIG